MTTLKQNWDIDRISPSDRIRVTHLSLGLCTGGLERLLVEFGKFTDLTRFDLEFVAIRDVGQPAEELKQMGYRVHQLPNPKGKRLEQIRALASHFRETKPHIVHTHNAYPHLYGTLAARWAGVPFVVHTRHGQRFGQSRRGRWYFWMAAQMVDRIFAVSDDAAKLCLREDKLARKKISRIWNGIDLQKFPWRTGSESPLMEGPPRAISVARLSAEKDFPTLLRSIPLVLAEVPDFQLDLIGDGGERERLSHLIEELNLSKHVRLLGERRDVPQLLREAGLFVSSSLTEGISLTLLEAMAVGLPIVATRVGGNPEIILDGENGLLVPPGDPGVMARAIISMCQERPRWTTMARVGRERVEREFSAQGMVRNYESQYRQIAAEKLLIS